MSDYTKTLWVVLMTPQKNMLTKISSLKTYGKLKIEEMKIAYGKKKSGSWIFQILGQPKSKTFSFHDGDVVQKSEKGYILLRRYSLHFCYSVTIFVFMISSVLMLERDFIFSKPVVVETMNVLSQELVPQGIKLEKKKIGRVFIDPKTHEGFLKAKRDFQYGKLAQSQKVLKKNLNDLNNEDKKDASYMLSHIQYLKCQDWVRQHEERKAVIACEKAIKFSPHDKAQQFLDRQDEKARKLYLEGYTIHQFNSTLAKQKYAMVLQSASSKGPWREKAQYQLRKLQ